MVSFDIKGTVVGKPQSFLFGRVAQLVEQWTENPCVAGSIPASPTYVAVMELVDMPDLESGASCVWVQIPSATFKIMAD